MGLIGSVTRFLVLVFGIFVPARRTYHALGTEQLTSWAKYWIVNAWFLCLELVGDTFLNWVPLYKEFKLIFVLWLVTFAPQASVWAFETTLDRLMWRYMPQIDDMLRYTLRNILSLSAMLCARSFESVVPMVSQIWRKPLTQAPQVVDTAPEVINPQFQDGELPIRNEIHDANDATMPPPARVPHNSFSDTPVMYVRRDQSKLSLPDLATKLPHKNLSKRGQLAQDLAIDSSANNEDILFDMEDLLKSERCAIEMQNRAVPVRKNGPMTGSRRCH